ncbi:MAG TPA: 4-hydroxy-tetrahydrodipicolinate synthase, partial [bacterium]|nr:4-hydroxy-tetrahydrodipicolinate synthase [bacterium]
GVVSVAGNVIPGVMRDLLAAARSADLLRAQQLTHALMPLFDALRREPNPIPIKAALAIVGIAGATPRLPLMTARDATRKALKVALTLTRELTFHGT